MEGTESASKSRNCLKKYFKLILDESHQKAKPSLGFISQLFGFFIRKKLNMIFYGAYIEQNLSETHKKVAMLLLNYARRAQRMV